MPGKLRCGKVNFTEARTLIGWLNALILVAADPRNTRVLKVIRKYHFSIDGEPVTTSAGWYVIHDNSKQPLYVGIAKNLNNRLNTDPGSLDNFAKKLRKSDSIRNFIKAFAKVGVLGGLKVVVLPEEEVITALGANCGLDDLDRKNVEKILGIFRSHIASGRLPRFCADPTRDPS